jgi:deoxyribodipyrimidine photo-lyase
MRVLRPLSFQRYSTVFLLASKVALFPPRTHAFVLQRGQSGKGIINLLNNHHRSTDITTRTYRNLSVMAAKRKTQDEYPPIPHCAEDLIPTWMGRERTKVITSSDVVSPKVIDGDCDGNQKNQCVYYWMQRDMRTADNWALLYAQWLAEEQGIPLRVLYVVPPPMPSIDQIVPPKVCEMRMTERAGMFLLGGLKQVESELTKKNVPFDILTPASHEEVGQCVFDFTACSEVTASVVVCDMSPLRQYRQWIEHQASPLYTEAEIPLFQVDAHNVVPVWLASPKREVGARTLRPKINKLLPKFLTIFPDFFGNSYITKSLCKKRNDWDEIEAHLCLDKNVSSVAWAKPGSSAAMDRFEEFTTSRSEGLKQFDTQRNDPNYSKVCSNLSPWVNYGHVSFQRLALDIRALRKFPNGTASFIEEGIVRRELSDNFVYYSQNDYDGT